MTKYKLSDTDDVIIKSYGDVLLESRYETQDWHLTKEEAENLKQALIAESWLPMESAPRDGSPFLGRDDDRVFECQYRDRLQIFVRSSPIGVWESCKPLAWQPFPCCNHIGDINNMITDINLQIARERLAEYEQDKGKGDGWTTLDDLKKEV